MSYLHTGIKGIPLWKIIKNLGNKSYVRILWRCKWTDKGKDFDELFGICSYDSQTRKLMPLDGDIYSLEDMYVSWEEWKDEKGRDCLTVWEYGIVTDSFHLERSLQMNEEKNQVVTEEMVETTEDTNALQRLTEYDKSLKELNPTVEQD